MESVLALIYLSILDQEEETRMKLFKKQVCCGSYDRESMAKAVEKKTQGSRIKVLGTGCTKCMSLENSVKEALTELNVNEAIERVSDLVEIASYGVMSTPALVIDGTVVSYGKVLSKQEVLLLLEKVVA